MRPVVLPDQPDLYDENAVREATSAYDYAAGSGRVSIRENAGRQKALIDDWLEAGGGVEAGGNDVMPVVEDVEEGEPAGQNYERDYENKVVETMEEIDANELAYLRSIFKPRYDKARRELIQRLGQYCSYCESPIGSRIAIEHRLPKSSFPDLAYRWSNFLLACDSCNAIKGNQPRQSWATGGGSPDLSDITQAILDDVRNIAWPHRLCADTSPFANPYLPINIDLWTIKSYYNNLIWDRPMTSDEVKRFVQAFRDGSLLVKDGSIKLGDSSGLLAGARVSPNACLGEAAQKPIQVMIDLVELNRIKGKNGNAAIDRRTELRTLAMLTAFAAREDLSSFYTTRSHASLRVWHDVLDDLIAVTGFWSVWITVLPSPDKQLRTTKVFPGTLQRTWTV